MGKFTKKLSAIALCTLFASMQVSATTIMSGDTGLGAGIGGASINNATGGYVNTELGTNSATLNFKGDSHVNWDTLNVNKGETLNFNGVNGATGLTVVNTVNNGMSNIYGQVNSNQGISKLIISNPNGMLYDGAKFTTAGDLQLTTQALGVDYVNGVMQISGLNQEALNGVTIKNSDFIVGGEFNITAPSVDIIKSALGTGKGLKLITADGQNYLVNKTAGQDFYHNAVRLETVSINGDVFIVADKDIVTIVNGGNINGNLNVLSDGNVALNYVNNGNTLNVTKNVDVVNDGRISYLRNSKVDGNVTMSNSGGFLEVANIQVAGDVNLKTTVKTNTAVKHFTHVVGDNDIKGNLNVDSIHNIHIGGYDSNLQDLAKGSLKVGGDINATAHEGTIAVTIDTEAKNINLTSGTLNIISDGKANIKADNYNFQAKNYIGGVDTKEAIMDAMENYKTLPVVQKETYLNIDGGNLNGVKMGDKGIAFIRANNDMKVNGVKAGYVELSSGKDIVIADDVHANIVRVNGETRNLTVNTPADARDYTLKYTNIIEGKELTIAPSTEITYDMANNEKTGWNTGIQTNKTTYLVVPGQPVTPDPGPNPPEPGPGPVPPSPDPIPNPPTPQDNDNVKVMKNYHRDEVASAIDAQEVYTPVAFAADLDDEIDTGVRKNVDGSVTVVRPYTPTK